MEYTIDAKGKSIGRIASEAAVLLMGKNTTSFARHKTPAVKVKIVNASKAKTTEKKRQKAVHRSYSGYPGGLKEESMAHMIGRKGYREAFRRAVKGMLPHNKLEKARMKNLEITE